MSGVSVLYYIICGLVAALVIWSAIRERDLKQLVLYLVILTPLILRLCRVN